MRKSPLFEQKQQESQHQNGLYLCDAPRVGRLSVGEAFINPNTGKSNVKTLDYFRVSPDANGGLLLAGGAFQRYQRFMYSTICQKDQLELGADGEAEAAKRFYFQIQDLERDISCRMEYRADGKLVCTERLKSSSNPFDHYWVLSDRLFDEQGQCVKQGDKYVSCAPAFQKIAFDWVEANYGGGAEAHQKFQNAIKSKYPSKDGGGFQTILRINAFARPLLSNGYLAFETRAIKSSIQGIIQTVEQMEQHIKNLQSQNLPVDWSRFFFCLSVKMHKSDQYGKASKYPVVSLSWLNTAQKEFLQTTQNQLLLQ